MIPDSSQQTTLTKKQIIIVSSFSALLLFILTLYLWSILPQPVLVFSIPIRLAACIIAIITYLYWRDWRTLPLALMFFLMASRQVLSLYLRAGVLEKTSFTNALNEFPGFVVTILSFVSILYLWQLFSYRAQVKQTEVQLALSEERFRSLSEAAMEGILFTDKGRIVDSNEEMCKMFGSSLSENIGKSIIDFISPEDRENVTNKIMSGYDGAPYEISCLKKDGSIFPVEIQGKMFSYKGRQLRVTAMRDISERKKAANDLVESHQRLLTVLNSFDAIVYVADMETYEILFANQALKKSVGNVIGKTCWQSLQQGQSGPCDFCTNEYLLDSNGKPTDVVYTWEYQNTITGQWLTASDRAIKWVDGRIVRLEIAVDITKRKQMEQELQKAHVELEQRVEERTLELRNAHKQLLHAEKLATIGTFSASIAHEFNNPLCGVINVINGIRKRAMLSDNDQKLADMALRECDRMKKLTRDLQQFNKPSSDKRVLTNINTSLDEILLFTKKELKTKKALVTKNFSLELPEIWVVPDQIKQVMINIIGNAGDALGDEGGVISIDTASSDSDSITVSIKDSGEGISAENIEHIFEPFYTTKAIKGTGLGLSVSYGIIKSHGGEIKVASEMGKGTTFSISIPIGASGK